MERSEEELREALLNLEDARNREIQQRKMAETLLEGLRVIVLADNPHTLFLQLFDVMRKSLDFEAAFVLTMDDEGLFRPQATSDALFEKTVWKPMSMFHHVIEGQPVAAFDTSVIAEWRAQPDSVKNSVRSALHFSIHPSVRKALFICTHSKRGHFSRDHITLTRRFSILATQALQKLETEKQLIALKRELKIKKKLAGLNKKLVESEERYRILFNLCPDGIVAIDPATRQFKYANPRFCSLLGYLNNEIVKMSLYDIQVRDSLKNVIDAIEAQVMGEEIVVEDIPCSKKDGSIFYADINVSSTYIDGERSSIGFFRDITEEKRLETQLQQSQKMEAIGTLAGGIAHDFNNILSAVLGFTELALDDASKGSLLEENLREVLIAGNRAKELVKHILTFARQTKGEVKPVRVNLIAKEVLKLIRSSIPATILIEQDIQSDSAIMADPTQIHQVFLNLCTNAAQAMEDSGGILKISIEDISFDYPSIIGTDELKAGKYIQITISDTGCGIRPNYINSIFEPYFTTKISGEGTGMGLATVHGIVKTYEGEITVKSAVGQGTEFKIFFPMIKNSTYADELNVETLPSGSEKILFVDDELSITRMSGLLLDNLGYKTTCRINSIEALELFRAAPERFDLVITDMTMPNMTGDILAAEMIKIRPDIPIIICTGYSKKMSHELASKIGVKALVMKPFVKHDLAKTIRNVLDNVKK